jgi:tRNA threonylcarbamoyladenosine biosynthesis protein TsaE
VTVVPRLAARGRLSLNKIELERWGEEFGAAAMPPLLVTFRGELGAGKTTLVQAICRGYGVTETVTSPTYALVHRYDSPRSPVFHVDLFRLDDQRQLTNIGWDEIVASPGLVLIEWPERAAAVLPPHVPIALEYVPGDAGRRILLAG